MWEVEYTDEFEVWWMALTQDQQEALDDRIMLLTQHGPELGRPVVGKIVSSRHPNMKELRRKERCGCCSLSTLADMRSCSSAATSQISGPTGTGE